jgi:hypothetical protein
VAAFANNDVWAVGEARPASTGYNHTAIEHYDGTSWSIVASPSGSGDNSLRAVTTVPATHELWAVGYYNGFGSSSLALIEHYDGTSWSLVSSPTIGTGDVLYGVTALASDDVWAAGSYVDGSNNLDVLIEHYNGTSWSVAATPSLASFAEIYGITATAANDVWAVGYIGPNPVKTLVEHFDGTSWSVITSPNAYTNTNWLYAVSATSASDVWAVGYDINPNTFHDETLIEHFDGTSWSVVASPNPSQINYLFGVAALAPNNVWAVGRQYDPVTGNQPSLILHYDGSVWSVVPSPNVDGAVQDYFYAITAVPGTRDAWAAGYNATSLTGFWYNMIAQLVLPGWKIVASPSVGSVYNGLNAVSALAPNNIWAAGASSDLISDDARHTLIEHWTGSGWSVVASPNPGQADDYLNGLDAISASNVWAVGASQDTSGGVTNSLALQWDGTNWNIVSTPNVGSALNIFTAIGGTSATDLWAVGYSSADFSGYANQTLVEHYNGTSWSIVPSPNVGVTNSQLNAVSVLSSTDVWAAGTYYDLAALTPKTLIEHWDGTQWSVVSSPNPGTADNELLGMTAFSSSNVWAVGRWSNSSGLSTVPALIEHWDGVQWSVVTPPGTGGDDELFAAAKVPRTPRLMAVGTFTGGPGNLDQALIQQWDSFVWSLVPHAHPGGLETVLRSIAVVSACNIWAVGIVGDQLGHSQTFVEHYIAPAYEGVCH